MYKRLFAIAAISFLFFSPGCSAQKSPMPKSPVIPNEIVKVEPGLAKKAKETAKSIPGVADSTAVAYDKNVSVGLKVSGFDRFRLDSIKKEAHDKIKSDINNIEVHVTTDKKLYKQLQELEQQINGENPPPPAEVAQKVEKINEQM